LSHGRFLVAPGRDLAHYHREKAYEIRAQNGGTCIFCGAAVTKDEYRASHFGGKCIGGETAVKKALQGGGK
jgi:hypothetical protein